MAEKSNHRPHRGLSFRLINRPGIFRMQAGDMVYYLFTDQHGIETKIPARVVSGGEDGILIRIGRYDVHTKQVNVMASTVGLQTLLVRQVPCSYEDELVAG